MPRRVKLETELGVPYQMLGITSTLHDYRLVHFLVKATGLSFKRVDDLNIRLSAHSLQLPLFVARDKSLRVDYLLLPNKVDQAYLIPAHKSFDFFLIAGGEGQPPLIKVAKSLQKSPYIQFCHPVDTRQWKEAPLFFHDLELETIGLKKEWG